MYSEAKQIPAFNFLIFILIMLLLLINKSYSSDNFEIFLKPALNKTNFNKLKNIDYIYMINLDERPEKFLKSYNQLKKYKIYPYRFSAVNGWSLPLATLNSVGVKGQPGINFSYPVTHYLSDGIGISCNDIHSLYEFCLMDKLEKTYFCYNMSLGAIGIVLSHLSILQDAYDSGYETIWVMEDDIEVIKDPNILSDIICELDDFVGKNNWDILFTDQDTKGQDGNYVPCFSFAERPNFKPSNPNRFAQRITLGQFRKIGTRYGAYSMILRRSGIKKILDFIKTYHVFLPYDFDYAMPNTISLYTVIDDIVSTLPTAPSDNAAPFHRMKTQD